MIRLFFIIVVMSSTIVYAVPGEGQNIVNVQQEIGIKSGVTSDAGTHYFTGFSIKPKGWVPPDGGNVSYTLPPGYRWIGVLVGGWNLVPGETVVVGEGQVKEGDEAPVYPWPGKTFKPIIGVDQQGHYVPQIDWTMDSTQATGGQNFVVGFVGINWMLDRPVNDVDGDGWDDGNPDPNNPDPPLPPGDGSGGSGGGSTTQPGDGGTGVGGGTGGGGGGGTGGGGTTQPADNSDVIEAINYLAEDLRGWRKDMNWQLGGSELREDAEHPQWKELWWVRTELTGNPNTVAPVPGQTIWNFLKNMATVLGKSDDPVDDQPAVSPTVRPTAGPVTRNLEGHNGFAQLEYVKETVPTSGGGGHLFDVTIQALPLQPATVLEPDLTIFLDGYTKEAVGLAIIAGSSIAAVFLVFRETRRS